MPKVATHTIEIDGKAYQCRFGFNAIRRVEGVLGSTVQLIGMRMVTGEAGITECFTVFWAALETARVHEKSRPMPWTMEEVGNMVDEFGSTEFFERVYPALLNMMTESFPEVKKMLEEKEAGKTVTSADPTPAAEAGTGTSS